MDYFYVGTGSPVGGLQNAYFKTKFTAKTFAVALDLHHFSLAQNLNTAPQSAPTLKKNLGNELDLVINYTLNKFTVVELGYSFMAASNSLEYVKKGSINQTDHTPKWAYLSINIRPDFFPGKPATDKK